MSGNLFRRLLDHVALVIAACSLVPGQVTEQLGAGVLALSSSTYLAPAANYREQDPLFGWGSLVDAKLRPPLAPGLSELARLVRPAGIIFSGRVMFVGRTDSSPTPIASTWVRFRVEHAIRGAWAGQDLTIHEWSGLWAIGERYRVGERVLLFLYAPSKLGLTSPVGGPSGRFEIDPGGRVGISPRGVTVLREFFGGKSAVSYPEFERSVRRAASELEPADFSQSR
jgi:hypothetical protein